MATQYECEQVAEAIYNVSPEYDKKLDRNLTYEEYLNRWGEPFRTTLKECNEAEAMAAITTIDAIRFNYPYEAILNRIMNLTDTAIEYGTKVGSEKTANTDEAARLRDVIKTNREELISWWWADSERYTESLVEEIARILDTRRTERTRLVCDDLTIVSDFEALEHADFQSERDKQRSLDEIAAQLEDARVVIQRVLGMS